MWKYLKVAVASLRIVISAVSLLLCLLLIVLWVRSYTHPEFLKCRFGIAPQFDVISTPGNVYINLSDSYRIDGIIEKEELSEEALEVLDDSGMVGWGLNLSQDYVNISAPYWFLVGVTAITATIAALPWIKWRFSLRTLLIVMTLFALFFGAVAWSL
jgi:hypothetical protein